MNSTFDFRDASSDELQTVEGGFLKQLVAWVRVKFDDTVKDLEAQDRMDNFEIQN